MENGDPHLLDVGVNLVKLYEVKLQKKTAFSCHLYCCLVVNNISLVATLSMIRVDLGIKLAITELTALVLGCSTIVH